MKTKMNELFKNYLNECYPNGECELLYEKDYELLIAVVLSAQCTDKRVNEVTKKLFSKYDLNALAKADIKEIEKIIRPVGSYTRKAQYIKEIASSLIKDYNGIVPNNRTYLENLKGVGHKTCNVVLSNLFAVPAFAVDTHVERVSKRLGFAKENDSVWKVEQKLMRRFPKSEWSKMHHQMVLFGRYHCKSLKPACEDCKLQTECLYYQKKKREK